jgi:hypothetical protein
MSAEELDVVKSKPLVLRWPSVGEELVMGAPPPASCAKRPAAVASKRVEWRT